MVSLVFFRIIVSSGAVHTLQRSELNLVTRCQLLRTITNVCSALWGLHGTPGMGPRVLVDFPFTSHACHGWCFLLVNLPSVPQFPVPATQLKLLWSKSHLLT